MKECNNQCPVPSIHVTSASSSSRMEKGRSLLRVLKNPPQPHMCIQDSLVKSNNPCFINVLSWSKLSSPTNPLDPIPLYGGMKVNNHSKNALQLTISSYSKNSGVSYRPDVYAVMVHPEVLRVSGKKCTDIKDRDAFIDLMLDFIEAMNPGIKFKRKFVVLVDRDLAGELKDIWHCVHSKRQREKINHSSHGEGDISYFSSSKRIPDNTIVRINKQTTKSMSHLSVQELCAAVDVALIDSSNTGTNKPNSWLFHRHFNDDINSTDNVPCCREIDHEENLVGWDNDSDGGGLFNLSVQSLFPVNLNPSLCSSPPSEASSALSFSEKKTFEEDSQVGGTTEPASSTRVVGEESLPKPMSHVYLSEDPTPVCSSSEILVPFNNDEDEDKSLFEYSEDKHTCNRPMTELCSDGEQGNLMYDEAQGILKTNQLATKLLDDTKHEIVPDGQPPTVHESYHPATVLCYLKQEIVADDQPPTIDESNQAATVLCFIKQDIVADNQLQTVHESNQPAVVLCDVKQEFVADDQQQTVHESIQPAVVLNHIKQEIVADDQPPTIDESTQPATFLCLVKQEIVADDQLQTVYESDQPATVLCYIKQEIVADNQPPTIDESQPAVVLCDTKQEIVAGDQLNESNQPTMVLYEVTNDQSGTEHKSNQLVYILCNDTEQGSLVYDKSPSDPEFSQPIMVDEHCDGTLYATLPASSMNTTAEGLWNRQDVVAVGNTVSSPGPMEVSYTFSNLQTNRTVGGEVPGNVSVELLESSIVCDHISDSQSMPLLCEECSGEDKENSRNISLKTSQQKADPSDCDRYSKKKNARTCNFERYPKEQDTHSNSFYDECASLLQNSILCNTTTTNVLGIKQNGEIICVPSLDGLNDEASDTSLKIPTDVSTPVTKSSKSIAVPEYKNNALAIAKTDGPTEDVRFVAGSEATKIDPIVHSRPSTDPIATLYHVPPSSVQKCKPLVRSLSQGDCKLSDVPCFAHSIANNFGVQKLNRDKLASGTVASQTSLPVIGKSNVKFGRKGYNMKSCKETVPHPGNNSRRPSSSAAVVSERPKTNTSPVRQQLAFNELGGPTSLGLRTASPANPRSSNITGRLRRQGTQNSAPVRPSLVTNTTILQSFGVLVPKENAPRRLDRKRSSKASEIGSKPLVDVTCLPSTTGLSKGYGEGMIERSSKKNAVKHVPPADSLKNKPKNVCDRNSIALRRSLCESNKSDPSQLLVVGANFNTSELGNAQSPMHGSLSSDPLKIEVGPEPKARKGNNSKGCTGGAHELLKYNSHFTKSKSTKVNTNNPLDCDLKNNYCSTSQALDPQKILNLPVFEEAGTPLCSEGQIAEAINKERGGTSQCSTVFVDFLPSLDTVALLNENVDKGLSSCKDNQVLGEVFPENDFLKEKCGLITDSPENLSRNGIFDVKDDCPQTKTEFQSHQDIGSCGSGTVSLRTDADGCLLNKSDLESNL